MKEITREMIKTFKLNKLGYDQMGYTFNNTKQLSYFEREHDRDRTKKGNLLIRREYVKERVKL